MQLHKGGMLEADIKLLQKQKDKALAEAERIEKRARPISSMQQTAMMGEIKLLERKKNAILKDMEHLLNQHKPLKIKIESARGELQHMENLLIQVQDQLQDLRINKEKIETGTKTYIDAEYKKVNDYKQTVLKEVVLVYETLDQKKKELTILEDVVSKREKAVAFREKDLTIREDGITQQYKELRTEQEKAHQINLDLDVKQLELTSLLASQRVATEQAEEKSKKILASVDAIEARHDEKARRLSQETSRLELLESDIIARENYMKMWEEKLTVREARLEDREKTLTRNYERYKSLTENAERKS